MVTQSKVEQLFDLNNKVALVTGAGQNIGRAMALALGHRGAKVAVIDLDADKAAITAAELQKHDTDSMAIQADVTDTQQVDQAFEKIIARWEKLDIAFNNVGLCYGADSQLMPMKDWHAIINTNLNATFYCCQQQFKLMQQNKGGKIINTASVAGVLVPHPQKITAYNTAKAAVIHLTKSLAAEWAEYNINVNAISPGTIHQPQFEEDEMQPWLKAWQQQIPAKRLANVDDLIGAAIFLASPASDYMTGQNLIIDGGHTLW